MIALLAVPAAPASAEVIDFNEFGGNFQGVATFTSGSLTFSSPSRLLGVWTVAPNPGEFNGTPYLLDGGSGILTVRRTDFQPFTLTSFDLAMGWYQTGNSLDMDVTYHLNGGGTSTAVLPLTLLYQTFTPGLSVTRVEFDISDSPNGYISMDNIVIDEDLVPEPSTLALLGLGLLAGGRRLRSRR